jgi:hypothetical protein
MGYYLVANVGEITVQSICRSQCPFFIHFRHRPHKFHSGPKALLQIASVLRLAIASIDSNVPSYELDVSQSQLMDFGLTILVSRDDWFSRFLIYYQDKPLKPPD